MALRLSAKVVGLDRAKAKLRDLPKVLRNRALRAGFRKIGQQLSRDMKRSIPGRGAERTGLTKKSIGVKVKLYRTSGNITVAVGPRSGFGVERRGKTYNPARVFHLVDGGTSRIRPRNYLRNTLARNRSQLMGLLMVEVNKAVAKWQSTQSGS